MEDKKANIIAIVSILTLVLLFAGARLSLKQTKPFFLIAGADIAVILAVFACLLIRRRNHQTRKVLESRIVSDGKELRSEYSFLRRVAGVPTKFTYKEIEEATDSFKQLIGRGASGSVFKGFLKDGSAVAVKRMEEETREKEFRSEVAAIAGVQHKNLVRLLGYSRAQGGPRFLIYDFIRNGSLDCWIFPRGGGINHGGCLSWDLRVRVAIDVAKALAYLHHDCRSRILHLDVKPENILLDENYRAIVSDFGFSKLMNPDESRVLSTIRGTKGYLAPEWLLENGISEKSDTYSFGMVLLEIIGGQRNVCVIDTGGDKRLQYFPRMVNSKVKENRLMDIVDRRLIEDGGVEEREVTRLVYVGLWCIQQRAELRPSMARVVEMLEGRVAVEEPPLQSEFVCIDVLADEEGDDSGRSPRGLMIPTNNDCPISSRYSYAMSSISPR